MRLLGELQPADHERRTRNRWLGWWLAFTLWSVGLLAIGHERGIMAGNRIATRAMNAETYYRAIADSLATACEGAAAASLAAAEWLAPEVDR